MNVFGSFFGLPFGTHLIIGTTIRLFLILYAQFHDELFVVKYTDIDYKVVTDASLHMINGESPYKRHTYRYSPMLALLLVPNVVLNRNFGKILFSLFDIIVGIVIRKLVKYNKERSGDKNDKDVDAIATRSALFWIYNPLAIVIATRGNADTLTSFFIVLSLLFHRTEVVSGMKRYFISGMFLGVAVHLRIYPLVFSLPMFVALGDYKINRRTNLFNDLYQMLPNKKQWNLFFGCVSTLAVLTATFFSLYGYEFLFESYIYHFLRKDTRHNFSLFFYSQYLSADEEGHGWYKMVPFLILLTYFGLRYGRKNTLSFSLFVQAIVMVVYNSVITSQYFVWFLSLLPLCIDDVKISAKRAFLIFCLWLGSQGAWLHYAYQLEFEGKNVFFSLWCQGVIFFTVNMFILYEFIENYRPEPLEKIKNN